jgi:hypothetical protein
MELPLLAACLCSGWQHVQYPSFWSMSQNTIFIEQSHA